LREEREALASLVQSVFSCGICMENHPEDSVARVDNCGHAFCRQSLREYIVSKLKERQFPIVCPLCSIEKERTSPASITESLVHQVGIPNKEYVIFEEMQLSSVSIHVTCRGCSKEVFIDRKEYEAASQLMCPLPGCNYSWCKACQQHIVAGGPAHSCDGSSELEHLMTQQGWKHCPGCKTPVAKNQGCNHMACKCKMHFCYICGANISQSLVQKEINDAVAAHFRRCSLIDDIPDRGVPP